MIGAWPVAEIRAAEEALMARLPEGALMQRAAHGLAHACRRLLGRGYGARVVLLVGAGNNGGDALYAGAVLARAGARVTALLLDPPRAHPGGLARLRADGGRVVPVPGDRIAGERIAGDRAAGDRAAGDRAAGDRAAGDAAALLAGADLVLDGIVGIGGSGGLRPAAAALAAAAAAGPALRLAVDVPSGVDSDTGAVPGAAFGAQVTVTFGGYKPGLLVGAGALAAGRVELVDIGLAPHLPPARLGLVDGAEVAAVAHAPGPLDDKYRRGVVGVAAGSDAYGGAAVLATGAAVRGGAGMVRYVGPAGAAVRLHAPEAVISDTWTAGVGRVQSWVVGPGMGTGPESVRLLRELLATDVPVLVDADGLTLLAERPELVSRRRAVTVLTPHDREFARLTGAAPGDDRVAAVRAAARRFGCVVLLKGYRTIVAGPDGDALVVGSGTPWLATAGSGDVLAGLTGAVLARAAADGRLPPEGAGAALRLVAAAAELHGRAGRFAAETAVPTASSLLPALSRVLRDPPGTSAPA